MLTFDEAAHRYFWNGQPVPGVTSILARASDFSMVDPDVLERKQLIGKAVHAAIELDLANDLDESTLHPDCRPYFDGWRKFQREREFVATHCERQVFHPLLKYAGTLDLYGSFNHKKRRVTSMVDTKCTAALPPSVGPQTAAYLEALAAEDKSIKHDGPRYCLHLKPDGTYDLVPLTDRADFAIFQSFLNVHRFLERHGLL